MTGDQPHALYRLREQRKPQHPDKKYRHTLSLYDEANQQLLAHCDLIGHSLFAHITITDAHQQQWLLKPNRKVMPSRWLLTDARQTLVCQFDQKILGKLVNPLYRVTLAMLDGKDQERLRIIDQTSSTGDLLFGTGPNEWAMLAGDQCVAKITRLKRSEPSKTGFMGKLQAFFISSDLAIASFTPAHTLAAPEALALLVIMEGLRNLANS